MAFNKDNNASFKYAVNPDFNDIVDERGNTIIAYRKVAWGNGEEKEEIRKWYVDIEKETPNKGVTFLTEDGPNNLVDALIKHGHGDTKRILGALKEREDFEESLVSVVGKKAVKQAKETESQDYYDPREVLGA